MAIFSDLTRFSFVNLKLFPASTTSACPSQFVSFWRNSSVGDLSRTLFHFKRIYETVDWNRREMAFRSRSSLLQRKRNSRFNDEKNAKKDWESSWNVIKSWNLEILSILPAQTVLLSEVQNMRNKSSLLNFQSSHWSQKNAV